MPNGFSVLDWLISAFTHIRDCGLGSHPTFIRETSRTFERRILAKGKSYLTQRSTGKMLKYIEFPPLP